MTEKPIGKLHRPQNKTCRIGASPGVSDELWNKNAIGGRKWDVATQERKVCNVEIEIVALVVKGSLKSTVLSYWQEQIQAASRSVALRRVFDLKLRTILPFHRPITVTHNDHEHVMVTQQTRQKVQNVFV